MLGACRAVLSTHQELLLSLLLLLALFPHPCCTREKADGLWGREDTQPLQSRCTEKDEGKASPGLQVSPGGRGMPAIILAGQGGAEALPGV